MLILICIITVTVFMGDILYDYADDALWWAKFHIPIVARLSTWKLNFDKRRRPKRNHYKYY